MGVTKRDVLLFVSILMTGCQGSNDMVLQPDTAAGSGAGSAAAGTGSGGKAGASTAGTSGTGGSAGKPPAAGSGTTGTAGTAGTTPAAGTGAAAGKAGTSASGTGGTGATAGTPAAGTGPVAGTGAAGEGGEAGTGAAGTGEAGTGEAGTGAVAGAADPECDFNGIWIGKQATVSVADGIPVPATSNNWYYLEFKQSGTNIEVSKHYDCGITVTGSVTVTVNRKTTEALTAENVQTGRTATVVKEGTNCKFESARFWSIRGAEAARFLPDGKRDSEKSIDEVASALPLPTPQKTDGAIDPEMDGKLGVAFQASGIVSGTRNSVQRDWTKWFTEPGFEINASADWKDELKIRADFDNEESILDADGLLGAGSTPRAGAKNILRLRFLGRDASDPRVAPIVKAAQIDTCFAIQDALPAETLE